MAALLSSSAARAVAAWLTTPTRSRQADFPLCPTLLRRRLGPLPGILAIYNDVIATSTAVYSDQPVTVEDRRTWWEGRVAQGYPVLVAVLDSDGAPSLPVATTVEVRNVAPSLGGQRGPLHPQTLGSTVTVSAPRGGIVLRLNVSAGMAVDPSGVFLYYLLSDRAFQPLFDHLVGDEPADKDNEEARCGHEIPIA